MRSMCAPIGFWWPMLTTCIPGRRSARAIVRLAFAVVVIEQSCPPKWGVSSLDFGEEQDARPAIRILAVLELLIVGERHLPLGDRGTHRYRVRAEVLRGRLRGQLERFLHVRGIPDQHATVAVAVVPRETDQLAESEAVTGAGVHVAQGDGDGVHGCSNASTGRPSDRPASGQRY